MILTFPEDIVDAIVARLEENRSLLTYKGHSIESIKPIMLLPENPQQASEMGFKAPWLGVYYHEGDADYITVNGEASEIEQTIGVLCASSPNYSRSASSAFESIAYSKIVHKILLTTPPHTNLFIVPASDGSQRALSLRSHKTPRELLLASSQLSLTVARFNFNETE